jgi:hypothetical protein
VDLQLRSKRPSPCHGIWRISQDVASLSITGYGVDENGKMDSHFRSISQPFEHQGVDEIMFARTDIASGDEHYSKSTLYIDPLSRRSWRSGPSDIRAQSVLYGYDEDGVRHAELSCNGLRRAERAWGRLTQGGQIEGALPLKGRVIAALSIVLLAAIALSMLSADGKWPNWPRWTAWLGTTMLAVSTLLNWVTPSQSERKLWGPVMALTLILAVSVLV